MIDVKADVAELLAERDGPNVPALIDLAEWLGAQNARQRLGLPSEWNQSDWLVPRDGVALGGHCGTAGCAAGYIVVTHLGATPLRTDDGNVRPLVELPTGEIQSDGSREPIRWSVDDAARTYLGLDHDQAYALFAAGNTFGTMMDRIRGLIEWAREDDDS